MVISVEAEIAVRRLHALCTDAVWRKDYASFENCYAENAVWKIAGRKLEGRAAIGKALGEFGAANERVLLAFGSPILAMDGEMLTGRTYVVEHVKRLDGTAASTIGIYYEKYLFTEGRCLFQWRHFDFAYFGPPDLSASFYLTPDHGAPPILPCADLPTSGLNFDA